jgi:hypothetical protein
MFVLLSASHGLEGRMQWIFFLGTGSIGNPDVGTPSQSA